MAVHFPEGHEIVRAEEVVEGSRMLTVQGTNTAELFPQLPSDILAVGKLGRRATRTQADQLKIKECRIVYRRAARPGSPPAYAKLATLTPTQYVNPNDAQRRKATKEPGEDAVPDEKKGEAQAEKKQGVPRLDEAVEDVSASEKPEDLTGTALSGKPSRKFPK
jgi:hypothetical protein